MTSTVTMEIANSASYRSQSEADIGPPLNAYSYIHTHMIRPVSVVLHSCVYDEMTAARAKRSLTGRSRRRNTYDTSPCACDKHTAKLCVPTVSTEAPSYARNPLGAF
jgi:hypothetical protein